MEVRAGGREHLQAGFPTPAGPVARLPSSFLGAGWGAGSGSQCPKSENSQVPSACTCSLLIAQWIVHSLKANTRLPAPHIPSLAGPVSLQLLLACLPLCLFPAESPLLQSPASSDASLSLSKNRGATGWHPVLKHREAGC